MTLFYVARFPLGIVG